MRTGFTASRVGRLWRRHRQPVDIASLSDLAPLGPCFGTTRGTAIDRYYIERHLEDAKHLIQGRLLEVAERRYSLQFGQSGSEHWVLAYHPTEHGQDQSRRVLQADLSRQETLPAAAYDCFICTQTLNSVYELKAAVQNIYHLLAPGGAVVGTVPGVSQITRYDAERWGDYWRFTIQSVTRLLAEVFNQAGDEVQVQSYGNLVAAIGMFRCVALEDLPDPTILDEPGADYPLVIGFVARKGPIASGTS